MISIFNPYAATIPPAALQSTALSLSRPRTKYRLVPLQETKDEKKDIKKVWDRIRFALETQLYAGRHENTFMNDVPRSISLIPDFSNFAFVSSLVQRIEPNRVLILERSIEKQRLHLAQSLSHILQSEGKLQHRCNQRRLGEKLDTTKSRRPADYAAKKKEISDLYRKYLADQYLYNAAKTLLKMIRACQHQLYREKTSGLLALCP